MKVEDKDAAPAADAKKKADESEKAPEADAKKEAGDPKKTPEADAKKEADDLKTSPKADAKKDADESEKTPEAEAGEKAGDSKPAPEVDSEEEASDSDTDDKVDDDSKSPSKPVADAVGVVLPEPSVSPRWIKPARKTAPKAEPLRKSPNSAKEPEKPAPQTQKTTMPNAKVVDLELDVDQTSDDTPTKEDSRPPKTLAEKTFDKAVADFTPDRGNDKCRFGYQMTVTKDDRTMQDIYNVIIKTACPLTNTSLDFTFIMETKEWDHIKYKHY